MNLSVIRQAEFEAEKSGHRMRMGAVIFSKKKIISSSTNYACRSARHLRQKYTRWKGSIHAEVAAVINAKRDLKGASIFVIRINRRGEWRLAKPCKHCREYLEWVGIRFCYYSTNDGRIIKENYLDKSTKM